MPILQGSASPVYLSVCRDIAQEELTTIRSTDSDLMICSTLPGLHDYITGKVIPLNSTITVLW